MLCIQVTHCAGYIWPIPGFINCTGTCPRRGTHTYVHGRAGDPNITPRKVDFYSTLCSRGINFIIYYCTCDGVLANVFYHYWVRISCTNFRPWSGTQFVPCSPWFQLVFEVSRVAVVTSYLRRRTQRETVSRCLQSLS